MGARTISPAPPRAPAFLGALLLGLAACKSGPPGARPTTTTTAAPRASEPPAPRASEPPPPDHDGGKVVTTVSDECGFLLDQIYFDHNAAGLSPAQRPIVDETAGMFRCFLRTGEITKWQVVGNADATEQDPAALSLSRARTVAASLVARGVAAATLDISGIGATQPQDPRGTPEARAKNRRVFFLALEPAGSSP